MKLGEKINLLRKQYKYTMQELADKANLTKGYISMLEKGENPQTKKEIIPSLETVQNIANAFDMDLETLLTNVYSNVSLPVKKGTLTPNTTPPILSVYNKLVPQRQQNVLTYANEQLDEQNTTLAENTADYKVSSLEDYKLTKIEVTEAVAAGRGYSYGEDEKTYCYTDEELPQYDIASYIVGDSMEPHYKDGDVVLISREMYSGSGVYVVDYDGKSFLKEVHQEDKGFRLVSFNKKYDDIFIKIPLEDDFIYFNIVGKVVGSFTPIEP